MDAKVLTVSDGVIAGTREDKSGAALADALTAAGFAVVERRVVADGVESVRDALIELADGFAGLIMTTGGTGFGPRDLTPEGTRAALEREAPGIPEAVRRASDASGRGFGMLSRSVAGTLGRALIVNARVRRTVPPKPWQSCFRSLATHWTSSAAAVLTDLFCSLGAIRGASLTCGGGSFVAQIRVHLLVRA